MTLGEFLKTNEVVLSGSVFSLCMKGTEIMKKSIDPIHDVNHAVRILDDLNRFLREERRIKKSEIDFEVLLLAICWHDAWKSQRFPKDIASMLFDEAWDGLGSMRMFAKAARKEGLSGQLVRSVKYSIRTHAHFQILTRKTKESQILKDLDVLEEWSLRKLKSLEEIYLAPRNIDPKLLRLAEFYFDRFMKRFNEASFYFEWPRLEFDKRKKAYLQEVNRLIDEYGALLD